MYNNKKSINMMKWAKVLFPINRSITGKGLRKTIKFIKKINKNFKKYKIRTNTRVYDWKIPYEWNISEAYIEEVGGEKICDFKENNLHILGYSKKIDKILSYNELKKKIFFIKNRPEAIPYFTSYYKKTWGFCISYKKFKSLDKNTKYRVVIKSSHQKGNLDYAELLIKGKSKKEIIIVSYICHPSMANNELSGPVVIMALSKIIKPKKYSIRLILIPETIGAIAYINKNYLRLKKNLVAGFNLSCVGDNGPFTVILSKEENTYADKIAKRIFNKNKKNKIFSFLKRGSNERQFGCQNLDLPFVTICRTRFGDYKEYHSSEDNLQFISEKNLQISLRQIVLIIDEIQKNFIFVKNTKCEPFFSKHNLIRDTRKNFNNFEKEIFDLTAYVDKNYDVDSLSSLINKPKKYVLKKLKMLEKRKIIKQFI